MNSSRCQRARDGTACESAVPILARWSDGNPELMRLCPTHARRLGFAMRETESLEELTEDEAVVWAVMLQ